MVNRVLSLHLQANRFSPENLHFVNQRFDILFLRQQPRKDVSENIHEHVFAEI